MTLNDPLANALSIINNHEKLGKDTCSLKPSSKILKTILEVLEKEKYVGSIKEVSDSKGNWIKLNLIGNTNNIGVIKPRYAVAKNKFEMHEKRYLPARNIGVIIVSTSLGIMTHHEAKKKNVGGKLIAFCY
tara:strand:+ start:10649 stop:11041 length:393 start_codon:yes stop_codon:yes gene_type:complete